MPASGADQEFYQKSGWDLRVVNESYKWVEKAIVFRPELRNWQSLVRDGLLEAGVDPYNGFSLEHLVGTKIGGSTCDSSGRRHADLLNYANPVNIQVAVYASVERVLLASTSQSSRSRLSAIGVVYLDQMFMFENRLVMVGESFLCFSFRPSFGLATQCPNREKGELLVRKFLMGLITFPALPHFGIAVHKLNNIKEGYSRRLA